MPKPRFFHLLDEKLQIASAALHVTNFSARGRLAAARVEIPSAMQPISFEQKLHFLKEAGSYGLPASTDVILRETHMSAVFLVGGMAFKLKKSIHLGYLDFSTLEKREKACRAELSLNRRLAERTYLAVIPLYASAQGLNLAGQGSIVDWLVVMRRLDDRFMLEHLALEHVVSRTAIDRLAYLLVQFYRRAACPVLRVERYLDQWRGRLHDNHAVLQKKQFALSQPMLLRIDGVQRRFLAERKRVLIDRWRRGLIREGHGDLRAEHVWLGTPITIFDCLEFNKLFRLVDPLDEIAQLSIECDRLGADWIGGRLERVFAHSPFGGADGLFHFYRCYRATLKARLALAHLLDPQPRTPEKWVPLAQLYLSIANREARILERQLKGPGSGPWIVQPRRSGSRVQESRLSE